MTSPSKVDAIKQAIKQVMEEVKDGTMSTSSSSSDGDNDGGDDHHRRLLSKLMSQLEKLESEPEESANNKVSRSEQDDEEEKKIVKELKELKRQNLITHCLVSVLIVITVVWQISEVSIILKLKDGVTHPFRSIGSIFKSMIKPCKPNGNGNTEDTEYSITNNLKSSITSNFKSSIASDLIESTPVHDLKIPDFSHLDLPKIDFGFNYEDRVA